MLFRSTDITGTITGSASTTSTTGNDTYTATDSTLTAGDVIADSSGTDVMNISATGNTAAATIVGVEAINANFTTFTAPTFDATNVTGGTVTLTQNQSGGSTSANVTSLGATTTVTAGSGVTGTLTVSANGNGTINGGDAATISATNVVNTGLTIVADDSTNNINLQDDNNSDVDDVATISGAGTVVLDPESANGQVVEVLNLSGNGAAVTFDITDANTAADTLETVTATGDQSVSIIASGAALNGEVFTDNTTAGTTTVTVDAAVAGTIDLDQIAADLIALNADFGANPDTIQFANNANVLLQQDVSASGNTILEVNQTSGDETLNATVRTGQGSDLDVSDIEVLNLTIDDNASTTGTLTIADLTGGASTDVNVTGADNLTLTEVLADNIIATDFTGVLTVATNAQVDNVTGGSGNDVITVDSDAGFTFSGNGGDDQITVAAASLTDQTVTVDGGTGTDTLIVSSTAAVGDRWTLSNLDVVQFNVDGTVDARDFNNASLVLRGDSDGSADTITFDMSNTTSLNLANVIVNTGASTDGGADVVVSSVTTIGSTITTTNGVDVVTGGTADDTITTGAGADVVNGEAGNDTIDLGAGADQLTADIGNDTVTLGNDTDTDTVTFDAALTNATSVMTITDFETGTTNQDVISIDEDATIAGVASILDGMSTKATSATTGYVEGTVGTVGSNDASTAFANNSIMVVTDSGFANFAAAYGEIKVENAGTDLTDIAVLFFNTTSSKAELWITDTTANTTNDIQLVSFNDVVTLAGVADFASENFSVV